MKILVVNDDGINSKGIVKLAALASRFGEVKVVAPAEQCSGMSQKLTINSDIELRRVDFPLKEIEAYSLTGTPADCVKIGLKYVMSEKPDWVFSGINNGANTGYDIAYSGTIGGAMEGLMNHVPSIAYSSCKADFFDDIDAFIYPVTEELLALPKPVSEIWNVNFPSVPAAEVKGILRDRPLAPLQMYEDNYKLTVYPDGRTVFCTNSRLIGPDEAPEGTDIHTCLNGYISIGKVACRVL